MKRLLALLLVIVCAMFVLTACQKDTDKNASDDSNNDNTQVVSEDDEKLNEGVQLLEDEKYEEAIEVFVELIEHNDRYVKAYSKCGDAYYGWAYDTNDTDKYKKAVEYYEKACEIDEAVETQVSDNLKKCYKEIALVSYSNPDALEPVMVAGDVDNDMLKKLLTQRICLWKIDEDDNSYYVFYPDGTTHRLYTYYGSYAEPRIGYELHSPKTSVQYADGYLLEIEFDKENMCMMYEGELVELVSARDVFTDWDDIVENQLTQETKDDFTQADMNMTASEYYKVREHMMNMLLLYLENAMSESEYDQVLSQQTDFEEDKQDYQQQQASKYEGGSLYPMEYSFAGAQKLRERYNELIEYLPQ